MLQVRKTWPFCTLMQERKSRYFLSHIQMTDEEGLDLDQKIERKRKATATDAEVKAVNLLMLKRKVYNHFTLI